MKIEKSVLEEIQFFWPTTYIILQKKRALYREELKKNPS